MDLEYFYDQIKDELCGAKQYIKYAIELKAMSPSWSKTLVQMSAMELEHASNLYNMAMEYIDRMSAGYSTKIPKYISDMKDKITDCYTDKSAEVKMLHAMYKEQ